MLMALVLGRGTSLLHHMRWRLETLVPEHPHHRHFNFLVRRGKGLDEPLYLFKHILKKGGGVLPLVRYNTHPLHQSGDQPAPSLFIFRPHPLVHFFQALKKL